MIKKELHAIRRGGAKFEEMFLCLLLTAMIMLACVQILLRDVFAGGLMWIDPLLRHLVLWSGLLGAAIATGREKHIAIDIVSRFLPVETLRWVRVLINLFSSGVSVALLYASVIFIQDEFTFAGGSVLGIPSWVLYLIFPLAFFLISCRFLIIAGYGLKEIIMTHSRRPDSSSPDIF